MRRKDREMKDKKAIGHILESCTVCRIAFNDEPFPYIVPVNYVYVSDCLYFHSASTGSKLDLIACDNHVCFEVDREIEVMAAEHACEWGTKYESVIGTGTASEVTDPGERSEALRDFMRKYSGTAEWSFPTEGLDKTTVVRVDIVSLTGKSSAQ